MRIAIFSDIHGNKEALKAVIDDIKNEKIDEIICLGDTIGIGPNPKECMDMIISNNINMVLGNHELYFLKGTDIDPLLGEDEIKHQNWVKEQITDEQKEFLEKCNLSLEKEIKDKKILFEHFLIDSNSNNEYPFYSLNIIKENMINGIVDKMNYDLIFIGHEHKEFNLDNKLYDGGSSGCRKDNITRYTILDTDSFEIYTKNIPFDRVKFEEALLRENYPDRDLIAKWFFGIEL